MTQAPELTEAEARDSVREGWPDCGDGGTGFVEGFGGLV